MVNEGKPVKEIVAFFKAQYNLVVPKHIFYSAKAKLNKVAGKIRKTKAPKKARNAARGGVVDIAPDNIVKDIVKILSQIHDGYKKIFEHLRLELLKSRGQVYSIMKGAGVEVAEEDRAGEVMPE